MHKKKLSHQQIQPLKMILEAIAKDTISLKEAKA